MESGGCARESRRELLSGAEIEGKQSSWRLNIIARRELLGGAEIEGKQSSWRLNIDEFWLSERDADHLHHPFSIRRLLRNKRKQRKVVDYYKKQERLL